MHAIPQPIAENKPASQQGPSSDLAAAASMIFEHDAFGHILEASEACGRLFGCSSYKLEGFRLTDLVAARSHPKLLDAMSRALRSGSAELVVDLHRGARVPHAQILLERAGTGLRSRLLPAQRRQLEPTRERVKPTLESDQLADVSHEIRTPLNAVIGFADALRQESFGPLGDKRYRDYARMIQESGQHVLALVNDLLDLSKADSDKLSVEREPVHVGKLIVSCAELMKLEAERAGLKLACDIAPTVGIHAIDPKVLRQILLNLLSNALKFTQSGGLSIRARMVGTDLIVAVEDTGVGMSEQDLARIGERFYQARPEGVRGAKGSGLGLALSSALAKAHGGRLDLNSRPGHGTVATMTISTKPDLVGRSYEPLERGSAKSHLPMTA